MASNILIAEDDVVLRNLYAKKFPIHGFDARVAADGAETIKMIQEQTPDLLLLDLRMPNVDGFQVLQQFPKDQRTFPIIALTNFHDPESKERALALGADEYYTKKDMTMRMLVDMVKSHLPATA